MRRLASALMVGLVVLGAAACGSGEGTADAAPTTAPSATAAGSDATKAACDEAVAMGEETTTLFTTKMAEIKAMMLGSENLDDAELDAKAAEFEAKGTEFEAAIRAGFTTWSEKLTALAAQDVEAPVKAALTDGAATLTKLNSADAVTPLGEVPNTLNGVTAAIKTACA